MEKLKAYSIFQLEMSELKSFLDSSEFAFLKVSELKTLIKKDKELKLLLESKDFDNKSSRLFLSIPAASSGVLRQKICYANRREP